MEFLDRDVKKIPSLSYTEYLEGIQSYECEDCETIIYPDMGYCSECVKPNLKHLPIFCCECRATIEYKTDYFLDNNDVSELPQVYLLCHCSKGVWLPLVRVALPRHLTILTKVYGGIYVIRVFPNMPITVRYISPSTRKRKKIFFFNRI